MPVECENEFTVKTFNKPLEKGNLFIKFDIEFPTFISEENKEKLAKLL